MIAELSEGLLAHYLGQPLIDAYAVYQHLMDYWAQTMQDDCYTIAADGWKAQTYRVIEADKKTWKNTLSDSCLAASASASVRSSGINPTAPRASCLSTLSACAGSRVDC